MVTPPVTNDTGLSWNAFYATNPVETQLQGLGVYDLPAVKPVKQMYSSTATAADVAALNAQRTNGTATFLLKARDVENPLVEEEVTEMMGGRHDWADSEATVALGTPAPPILLVNGSIPVMASGDIWVRQSAPGSSYPNDWVSVWNSEGTDSTARAGVLEFDLTGLPEITDAKLALYSIKTGSGAWGQAFEQKASLLEAATMPTTWNEYAAADASAFESLGHYLLDPEFLAPDAPGDVYLESDAASSVDLAALNAIRTGDGNLIMGLDGFQREITYMRTVTLAGSLDWSDTESTYAYGGETAATTPSMWPRLILNSPRLLGDANEDGVVDDKDASALGAHWMAAYPGWGGGDFNEDGIANDADAAIMAAHWGETAPTEGGNVPEPSTIALILCGLAALVVMRRRATA